MPTTLKPLKAVLFDLDNTLTHRFLSIERYSRGFIDKFGPGLDHVTVAALSKLVAQADHGGYLPEDSPYTSIRDAVGFTLLEALPWKDAPGVDVLAAHWKTHFPKSAVPMPGAAEAISVLERLGFLIGIISNGAHDTRKETVNALEFKASIRVVISSEIAGAKKPSPGIFHHAASELGVAPHECVYVGDHPENDYWGAEGAGMRPVWLRGFHPWPAARTHARQQVASLPELPGIIMAPADWA